MAPTSRLVASPTVAAVATAWLLLGAGPVAAERARLARALEGLRAEELASQQLPRGPATPPVSVVKMPKRQMASLATAWLLGGGRAAAERNHFAQADAGLEAVDLQRPMPTFRERTPAMAPLFGQVDDAESAKASPQKQPRTLNLREAGVPIILRGGASGQPPARGATKDGHEHHNTEYTYPAVEGLDMGIEKDVDDKVEERPARAKQPPARGAKKAGHEHHHAEYTYPAVEGLDMGVEEDVDGKLEQRSLPAQHASGLLPPAELSYRQPEGVYHPTLKERPPTSKWQMEPPLWSFE